MALDPKARNDRLFGERIPAVDGDERVLPGEPTQGAIAQRAVRRTQPDAVSCGDESVFRRIGGGDDRALMQRLLRREGPDCESPNDDSIHLDGYGTSAPESFNETMKKFGDTSPFP